MTEHKPVKKSLAKNTNLFKKTIYLKNETKETKLSSNFNVIIKNK